MKNFLSLLPISLSLFLLASPAAADVLLEDGFESADMSATNEDGFEWGKNNRTSVITKNAAVWNNKEIYNEVTHSNWAVKEGSHALRFRYPAGASSAEQRFQLGRFYSELWFRYWIRVPVNFKHGALNNKWFSIWGNTYDKFGTVTWQTRPDGNGGAKLVVQDGGVISGERLPVHFITFPDDQGRWMQIVIRVQASTSANSADGAFALYRRWEGESSFTKLQEKLDANTWDASSSTPGFSQGYFMGWANDPYTQTTEWIMDDVVISTSSLLNDNDDSEELAPPNPPILSIEDES